VIWLEPRISEQSGGYAYTCHRLLSDLYLVLGLK
jgi:hypothetical protein